MHPVRTNAANAEKIKFLIIFNPFLCAMCYCLLIIEHFTNLYANFTKFIKILQNFEILMDLITKNQLKGGRLDLMMISIIN